MERIKFAQWLPLMALVLLSTVLFVVFTPMLKIKRAGLQIDYNNGVGHASVFLNDQFLEKAPLAEKNIQSGEYILKIVPDEQGLAEFSTPISLHDGALTVVIYNPGPNSRQSSAVIYELFPKPKLKKTGLVSFESYPENALLSFNGGDNQYTPITIADLTPGEHRFVLSLPSYAPIEKSFQVLAGYETRVTITLAKLLESTLNTTATDLAIQVEDEATDDEAAASETTVSKTATSSGARVKIKATNFFVDGEEVLRVRASASNSAAELGFAKSQTEYLYLGEPTNDASPSATWYQIQFNDQPGWVSASFAELVLPD